MKNNGNLLTSTHKQVKWQIYGLVVCHGKGPSILNTLQTVANLYFGSQKEYIFNSLATFKAWKQNCQKKTSANCEQEPVCDISIWH